MATSQVPVPSLAFGPPPQLWHDEQWIAHYAANRMQGRRAMGGRLYVTSIRVMFTPHRLDALLGGKHWSCRFEELSNATTEAGRDAFGEWSALRDSTLLCLDCPVDQSRQRFVVSDADERAAAIRTLIAGAAKRPRRRAETPLPVLPPVRLVRDRDR